MQSRHGIPIVPEKSLALASTSPRLLVGARAGSGKSTLLAIKTLMIAEYEQINPDEILVLAFNKKAATEIKAAIRDKYQVVVNNARTFHSLANQIAQPEEDVLSDRMSELPGGGELSDFVRQAFDSVLDDQTRSQLYSFFR